MLCQENCTFFVCVFLDVFAVSLNLKLEQNDCHTVVSDFGVMNLTFLRPTGVKLQ
eukprot:TRINITY_DN3234_c0_g1_i2.p1 TRINITY_DN3234_c0_g1~~TRINITY_DN3234_c0_g1_i2.p1  ORF type:complete len:55 (-),score=0.64 TRINITY_DN3234_c0_g1_i2:45-209(-)